MKSTGCPGRRLSLPGNRDTIKAKDGMCYMSAANASPAFRRASGILLHPTSLPGRFGIGDFGEWAYRFVDFLADARQSLWQVLPLGPTGYGDSPYQSFSAFAGNPLLISPQRLVDEGRLPVEALRQAPSFSHDRVDYGAVMAFKLAILRQSFAHFSQARSREQQGGFQSFCEAEKGWLDDYALFMALKEQHGGVVWTRWERELSCREPEALGRKRRELADQIAFHQYVQYEFFRQWSALKEYANRRGIRVIGDVPIFVAHDSADVWAHPELFHLDESGEPTVVAGVPPDYFSETGQLWGNPLYRWEGMARDGYAWWIARLGGTLRRVDIVRLDHFRGFEAYWEVPAGEKTAVRGRWVAGPGAAFFRALREALGDVPIIAEDLGVITPEVKALRDEFGFPGMKVLQFAFSGDADNEHLPHNYTPNCVVYTGTHDNDTTMGWFTSCPEEERDFCLRYLGSDGREVHWDLIRLAMMSVAHTVIVPLQDVLGLGTEARMNYPSRLGGNWAWRFTPQMLTEQVRDRLAEMTETYGRAPGERRLPRAAR